MNRPVLVLYLEDNPRDAELVRDKLQQTPSLACELRVASNRAEYEAALAEARFDLILSDYALPDYDGMAALALAREKQPEVPFILVSGTLGEERAVDCVVRGATDYVLKQNLNRLVPAMLRALTEAEEHRRHRVAEDALRESETQFRELFNQMSSGVAVYEAIDNGGDFVFRDFNPAAEKIERVSRKDILGRRVTEAFPGVRAFGAFDAFQRVWRTGRPEYLRDAMYEDTRLAASWRETWVYKLPSGEIVAVYNDVTERKRAAERIASQLEELQRWEAVMLDREDRVREIKREVNELCRRVGEDIRYRSEEAQ